jgi:hypothetical protein
VRLPKVLPRIESVWLNLVANYIYEYWKQAAFALITAVVAAASPSWPKAADEGIGKPRCR